MRQEKYIIGIDGGGTKTEAILFNDIGETLMKIDGTGTNLYVYKEDGVESIISLIDDLTKRAGINISDISALGCSLAGISDLNSRDLLLKDFDKLNITSNALVLSDTESAYQLLCPTGQGLLVSIGTGIVCLGRDKKGTSFKVAGKGYDKGDVGSGYWIGKEVIKKIVLNQSILSVDDDMIEIYNIVKKQLKINDISSLESILANQGDMVYKTALLAKDIIESAENGNDISLSIIQEGTYNVAEYILFLIDELKISKDKVIIAGNGSIIKNKFYRKSLNDSLQFDINDLHWIFSDISCAYSAGIMAAKYKKINISINNIVKNIN